MTPVYEVRHLSFRYPGETREVLHDVSLRLEAGQVLAILGPNGAGKSTLLNCMAGLLTPGQGEILLGGQPLAEQPRMAVARQVAYVQQATSPVFSYSVYQYVMMGRAPRVRFFGRPGPADEDAVWQALEKMDIEHLAGKMYGEISGGERQQCAIARAIAQQPQALLFDEPTSHLDFGRQVHVLNMVKRLAQQGYAVAMTTHNPDHVLLLNDHVATLDDTGALQYGRPEEIIRQDTLQKLYHTSLQLVYVPQLQREVCLYPNLGAQAPTPPQ